ncbi:MAG: hypothetical protein ABJF23_22310 [Bryobacteraceae bacterium]
MRVALFIALMLLCGASPKSKSISKAYVDPSGARHIVDSDGRDVKVPKERGEVDPSDLVIAEDKQSAGWRVSYDNSCCTSYSIPQILVIYRLKQPLLHLGNLQMLVSWKYLAGGKQVAFYTNTVHGDLAPHFSLYDVRTGRMLDQLDGHPSETSPAWADGLDQQ